MRKSIGVVAAAVIALATAQLAKAEPALQLDIVGGNYVGGGAETTFTSANQFKLAALLDSANGSAPASGDTFYVVVSLVPIKTTSASLGSFTFAGNTVNVTSDMTFGTPAGLPSHGQFANYYTEFAFTFDPNNKSDTYDVSTETPPNVGPVADPSGGSLFNLFDVDKSGLAAGVQLHFDLIHKNADGNVDKFAPFSHDAETNIPEPTGFILTAAGLSLFGLIRRRRA